MLVARRKPGQKKTYMAGSSGDKSVHDLGRDGHGLMQEPTGESRNGNAFNEGVDPIGLMRVGRDPNLGVKRGDNHVAARSSPSVKGKKALVRSQLLCGRPKGKQGQWIFFLQAQQGCGSLGV